MTTNYDKLYLKKLFNQRDTALLTKVKPEYFRYNMAKSTIKLLKSYVAKYGSIPTLEVFDAVLTKAMAKDKADIFSSYLKGLENIEADASEFEILDGLKSQYILTITDNSIEELVSASADKDTVRVKELIRELSANLNVSEKGLEDINASEYNPSKIRLIQPFLESMRDRGNLLAGLNLIGAPSGGGKSVWLVNQLLYSYKKEKLNCALINLELSYTETIARLYSCATGESFSEVYGNTDTKVVAKVNKWKDAYFTQDNKFSIQNCSYDVDEIAEVIMAEANKGVTVFFIDYLTLVEAVDSSEDWKVLTKMVRKLHALTQDLDIVIVTPVQINIQDQDEQDGELVVTTRGSKELLNSATNFWVIYTNPEERKESVARIFTLKARNAKKHTYVVTTEFNKMRLIDTGIVI